MFNSFVSIPKCDSKNTDENIKNIKDIILAVLFFLEFFLFSYHCYLFSFLLRKTSYGFSCMEFLVCCFWFLYRQNSCMLLVYFLSLFNPFFLLIFIQILCGSFYEEDMLNSLFVIFTEVYFWSSYGKTTVM